MQFSNYLTFLCLAFGMAAFAKPIPDTAINAVFLPPSLPSYVDLAPHITDTSETCRLLSSSLEGSGTMGAQLATSLKMLLRRRGKVCPSRLIGR